MRIGELAQVCGVSRDTLRFYEERGLIQARRLANGYRDYPDEIAQLVHFIRNAQRLGFSLNEIGNNVEHLWHSVNPDQAVEALLRDKVALVEQRLDELQRLRSALLHRLTLACPLRDGLDLPEPSSTLALTGPAGS